MSIVIDRDSFIYFTGVFFQTAGIFLFVGFYILYIYIFLLGGQVKVKVALVQRMSEHKDFNLENEISSHRNVYVQLRQKGPMLKFILSYQTPFHCICLCRNSALFPLLRLLKLSTLIRHCDSNDNIETTHSKQFF